MRSYSVRFWSFLSVLLFASLLVGCDIDRSQHEVDRPAMAPTPEQLSLALRIIAADDPIAEVPWAYSIVLDLLGVIVSPRDISAATYTVGEIGTILADAGVELAAWLPQTQFVSEVLSAAVATSNTPGFDPDTPENAALAALASSLENRGVTDPGQVNDSTQLTHGDLLILLVCMHQSTTAEAGDNALADAVDEVLDNNNAELEDLPELEDFIEGITGISVEMPHQGGAGA